MARKKKNQTTEEITIETITTEPNAETTAPEMPCSFIDPTVTVKATLTKHDYDLLCADARYFGDTIEERMRDLIVSALR